MPHREISSRSGPSRQSRRSQTDRGNSVTYVRRDSPVSNNVSSTGNAGVNAGSGAPGDQIQQRPSTERVGRLEATIATLKEEIRSLRAERDEKLRKINDIQAEVGDFEAREDEARSRGEDGGILNYYIRRIASRERERDRLHAAVGKLENDIEKREQILEQERVRLKWLPEVQKPPQIESGRMHFVNRDDAVESLLSIHISSRLLRDNKFSGSLPKVAIIDDTLGMGKTTFGCEYISCCRREIHARTLAELLPRHKDKIVRSKTLIVRLSDASLSIEFRKGKDFAEKLIVKAISKSLDSMIKSGLMTGNIERLRNYEQSDSLLTAIMEETGYPLFVVLDEIQSAFNDDSFSCLAERRREFFKFCGQVLGSWITVEDLFFLLVGRGDLFDHVGNRTGESNEHNSPGSPFDFRKISLKLISENHIETIVASTYKKKGDRNLTLKEYYNIQDEEMEAFALEIREVTDGHPRTMFEMFQSCETRKMIQEYSGVQGILAGANDNFATVDSRLDRKDSDTLRRGIETNQSSIMEKESKSEEAGSRIKWLDAKTKRALLDEDRLFFVNRHEAAEELFRIHLLTFLKVIPRGGELDKIAFMDDSFGMGKTTFGENYIQCAQEFLCESLNHHFCNSFRRARTLVVKLSRGRLLSAMRQSVEECERVLMKEIISSLLELQGIEFRELDGDLSVLGNCTTSFELLKKLIKTSGTPLFIVLDEIPSAFSGDDDIEERLMIFIHFSKNILQGWLKVVNLFFLLVGRGDIFNYIGTGLSDVQESSGSFVFHRISLKLIRSVNVKKILQFTYRISNGAEISL